MKVEGRRVGPLEPHDATPMTRSEFDRAFRASGVDNAPITVTWDDIKRIAATIDNGGWAADPPSPADLDAWAAERIMGWHRGRSHWVDRHDTAQHESADWQPSQNLGQALECVAKSDYWCQAEVSLGGIATLNFVRPEVAGSQTIYEGPYDEAAMAEALLRHLHAELAS